MVNSALKWQRRMKAFREQKELIDDNEEIDMSLNKLNESIQVCSNCDLYQSIYNRLDREHGYGKLTINHEHKTMFKSSILFIGLSPSYRRFDKELRAMKGVDTNATLTNFKTTGDLFRLCLKESGLLDYDIYITNLLKCSTLRNSLPTQEQIDKCISWLKQEIELIKPNKIILLGNEVEKILIGKIDYHKKIFHPSYLFRMKDINKTKEYITVLKTLK